MHVHSQNKRRRMRDRSFRVGDEFPRPHRSNMDKLNAKEVR
jgi:hypothetical protein